MSRYVLGVDPGISGAVALLDGEGAFIALHDLPTMNRNKSDDKQQINCAALQSLLRDVCGAENNDVRVIMERVTAMPSIPGMKGGARRGMGAASAMIFGKTVGHIEGVVICQGWPIEFVQPGAWKKAAEIPKDKQAARTLAQQLFPMASLYRQKDHNRAEALLIARWYVQRLKREVRPMLRKRGT